MASPFLVFSLWINRTINGNEQRFTHARFSTDVSDTHNRPLYLSASGGPSLPSALIWIHWDLERCSARETHRSRVQAGANNNTRSESGALHLLLCPALFSNFWSGLSGVGPLTSSWSRSFSDFHEQGKPQCFPWLHHPLFLCQKQCGNGRSSVNFHSEHASCFLGVLHQIDSQPRISADGLRRSKVHMPLITRKRGRTCGRRTHTEALMNMFVKPGGASVPNQTTPLPTSAPQVVAQNVPHGQLQYFLAKPCTRPCTQVAAKATRVRGSPTG